MRLPGPKPVERLTADHLEPGDGRLQHRVPVRAGPGYGFGFGFAVRREAGISAVPGSVGDYNWSGLGGTTFWVDPHERLIGVLMTQAPNQRGMTRQVFKTLVLQAIVK